MAETDDEGEEFVNLTGVFKLGARFESEGLIRLDAKYTDWAAVERLIVPGTHTKIVSKGVWQCINDKCALHRQCVDGEYAVILQDGANVPHYATMKACIDCEANCLMLPVAVFVQYLTRLTYDALRIRMQRQATPGQPRDRAVAKVHVFAQTRTQQPVSTSPYPGRVLGPDGELLEWLHSGIKEAEEQAE